MLLSRAFQSGLIVSIVLAAALHAFAPDASAQIGGGGPGFGFRCDAESIHLNSFGAIECGTLGMCGFNLDFATSSGRPNCGGCRVTAQYTAYCDEGNFASSVTGTAACNGGCAEVPIPCAEGAGYLGTVSWCCTECELVG